MRERFPRSNIIFDTLHSTQLYILFKLKFLGVEGCAMTVCRMLINQHTDRLTRDRSNATTTSVV